VSVVDLKQSAERIMPRSHELKKIRNIGIMAHIDAG